MTVDNDVFSPMVPSGKASFLFVRRLGIMKKLWSRLGVLLPCLLMAAPAAFASDPGTIDTGDTAWVLISAALVFIMTPGLGFFYGGMVRNKNVLTTIMQSFFIVAMISVE